LSSGGFEYDKNKAQFPARLPDVFLRQPGQYRRRPAHGAGWRRPVARLDQMVGRAIGRFELEDGSSLADHRSRSAGLVITDGRRRRFANETVQANLLHGFYYGAPCLGPIPRKASIRAFPATGSSTRSAEARPADAYTSAPVRWASLERGQRPQIERGWISPGNSIAAAAAAAGVHDPAAAQASVMPTMRCARAGGHGDPMGREAASMVALDEGPSTA
jgi:hypothetical protein